MNMIDLKKFINAFLPNNKIEGESLSVADAVEFESENQPVVRDFETQQTSKPLVLPKLSDKK